MTRFHRNAVALGTAAALALAASSALAGPTGSFGTQVKQAVPNSASDIRFRRGGLAAGVAIGAIGAAVAIGAANNSYGYGSPYGDGYYGGGYYDQPYYGAAIRGLAAMHRCRNAALAERKLSGLGQPKAFA